MNWEKKISNRFFHNSKDHGKFLGIVAMIGIGIGCFAMVIAISVMNGFETIVHDKLKGFEGDIRVYGNVHYDNIKNTDGISSIMPFMERNAVIEFNGENKVVTTKAIETTRISSFYNLNLRGSAPKREEIIIGQDLAYKLGINIGDEIILFSPLDQQLGLSFLNRKKIKVSGIFSTKILNYDDRFAFISLYDGKQIFKRKSVIDGYDLRIAENYDIGKIYSNIKKKLRLESSIETWSQRNQSLVDAMKMERFGTIIILCLIFFVASFNLAANLTLISIQKMREIAILRAMGAKNSSIYKLIIHLGLKRSGRGALYGFFTGIITILLQNKYSIIPLPVEVYFINALPMVFYIRDFILIFILSIFFILTASYISGRKLVSSNIIEAIHWAK